MNEITAESSGEASWTEFLEACKPPSWVPKYTVFLLNTVYLGVVAALQMSQGWCMYLLSCSIFCWQYVNLLAAIDSQPGNENDLFSVVILVGGIALGICILLFLIAGGVVKVWYGEWLPTYMWLLFTLSVACLVGYMNAMLQKEEYF